MAGQSPTDGLAQPPGGAHQRAAQGARARRARETPTCRRTALPLARHLAETVAGQRILIVINLGILLIWTGQLIASPSAWRLGLVVLYAAVTRLTCPWILRNERRARRFLADHPAPGDDASGA